jgi:hypothetical protein
MTNEQFVKYTVMIKAYFPSSNAFNNPMAMNLWFEMLQEIDFDLACVALKRHVATAKFPPTVNDILTAVADNKPSGMQTAAEAWNSVLEAIRKYGQYDIVNALASLQEPTKSIMRNQFREVCQSENIMADRAHFMKMYDTYAKRDQTERLLPETLKNEVKSLTDTLAQKMLMDKPNG